jgi:hypothetical protein
MAQQRLSVPLLRLCFARYAPTKVLPLLSQRCCFFAPMFFWFRGRFVDPWRDLAVNDFFDMSGRTEPVTGNAASSEDGASNS